MKIIDIYNKSKDEFLIYLIVSAIFIILIGVVLAPEIFYDQWIWKHYWGPVVADAQGGVAYYNGVAADEGYTMLAEITYGIILIIAIYFIYRLLKKLKVNVDWRFALSLLPFIIYGPVSRVLEDSEFFTEPVIYWFISPLIYLQIGFFAIGLLIFGYFLQKNFKSEKINVNNVIFVGGLFFLAPSLYYISRWIIGDQWSNTSGVRFDVFLIVTVLVMVICGVVYLIANYFKDKRNFMVYTNPLNLSMLAGHLIDGITSYISIKDPFLMGLNYSEKHPASNFLLELWGPSFPIVKFFLIIIVIYVFDVLYKDEFKDYLILVNLLKIGILILGFSPGLRDLLRVTMGV